MLQNFKILTSFCDFADRKGVIDDEELININLHYPGRGEVNLELWVDSQGLIVHSTLSGVGGPELLEILDEWRPKLVGSLHQVEVPKGQKLGQVLLREALLKSCGKWDFPVREEYLCHCRGVKTTAVDLAVITGSHNPTEVAKQTSASTGCGTCQAHIEAVIAYRLDFPHS